MELARLCEQRSKPIGFRDSPPQERAGHHEHKRRRPVLDCAQQVHSPKNDVDVQAPEQKERQPFRRRVPTEPGTKEGRPAGDESLEHRVQCFAPDPGLNAEPAARDERPHQRRDVGAERAVRGARENRKGNAVLRTGMRIEQDGREHDRVAEKDGRECLRPIHAGGHQAGSEHVGRDAVRHADPQRRVVVRRPGAPGERHGREIVVIERARLDTTRVDELDAAIRQPAFVGHNVCSVRLQAHRVLGAHSDLRLRARRGAPFAATRARPDALESIQAGLDFGPTFHASCPPSGGPHDVRSVRL